jgi:endonuclease/exonuclease/phosphatase family metal-dependent hydrolase
MMTYNLLNDHPKFANIPSKNWADRSPYVLKHIDALQPDILAIQEGSTPQIEAIKAAFPAFDYYGPQAGGNHGGEQVGIFYDSGQFGVLDKGTFWLSNTPEVCSRDWGAGHHRICTWIQFEERQTGRSFFHLNTHLDAQKKGVRALQIQVILDKIAALVQEDPSVAIVLTGDLNASSTSLVYRAIAKANLADAFVCAKTKKNALCYTFAGIDKQWTWTKLLLHIFYPRYMHKRLDHIFVSSSLSVEYYEISNWSYNNWYPSDHWPVLVEIKQIY